ncbi:MAG TPA: twin-arginine translocation pathway signal protein [Pseudomonas xinjiangensis]|uniref:Twin-arginine translocation pathway signal protein n=2 Tax=root TaxID=1 RepID=A0A7V1FQN1_9GAMM|nr:twin-arginine translocation pathway signal protein [Halopseudomonas xinjiangensis]HEC49309.1 twin-arginine translocation pathway signal protein [Halopseudomonas xinjiangensis]
MASINPPRLNRRELLKLTLGASLALSTVGVTASLTGCTSGQPADNLAVLRQSDLPVLAALFPAMVGPHPAMAGDNAAVSAAIEQLDRTLAHTSPAVQKDVLDLLGLLSFGLTRGPMTGIWTSWEKASPADLDAFLFRWRDSRLDMLRQGHKALSQLLLMSWYALPLSWKAAGYPGPPII